MFHIVAFKEKEDDISCHFSILLFSIYHFLEVPTSTWAEIKITILIYYH